MKDLRDQYDWVVLGDHPGALLSGCLVAKLGYSVLILDILPSILTHYSPDGIPVDPEPSFLMGLGQLEREQGVLARCLHELGFPVESARQIEWGHDSMPQAISPAARVRFVQDNRHLLRELDVELGQAATKKMGLVPALELAESQVLEYWNRYPIELPQSVRFKKPETTSLQTIDEVRHFLSRLGDYSIKESKPWFKLDENVSLFDRGEVHRDIWEFLSGLWTGCTGAYDESPALIDVIHSLCLARTGGRFVGGMTAYRKFLKGLARNLGAHVAEDIRCRRVFVENGRLIGVQATRHGQMIGTQAGILGCGLDHAKDFLYVSGANWKPSIKKSPTSSQWRFTVSLLVHSEAIPPGLARNNIWKEERAPALEIEIVPGSEYGLSDKKNSVVFLRTGLAFKRNTLQVSTQQMIAARMFKQACQILPFLEYHVVGVYPDFRQNSGTYPNAFVDASSSTPYMGDYFEQFSDVYGFVATDMIPENLRIYDGPGVGSFSGIDRLFVANCESFPSFGSFGPTLAALESTTWFVHHQMGLQFEEAAQIWKFFE